jgi:hypothetical protein
MRANNWVKQADQAIIRAAARARALAASTNTPIHVMKDGKIVEIRPEMEGSRVMPTQPREEQDLSVVREDPPSYGDRSP